MVQRAEEQQGKGYYSSGWLIFHSNTTGCTYGSIDTEPMQQKLESGHQLFVQACWIEGETWIYFVQDCFKGNVRLLPERQCLEAWLGKWI